MCVREIVNNDKQHKNFDPKKLLSEAAIRKKYQRHRSIPPEQRLLLNFKQKQIAERKKSVIRNNLFAYDPIEKIQSEVKLPFQDKVEEITRSIYAKLARMYSVTAGYALHRTGITAHGIWVNYELAQNLLNDLSIDTPIELPIEKLVAFSILFFLTAVMAGLYMLPEKHSDIVYLTQYGEQCVLLSSESGQTLIVGDCVLSERYLSQNPAHSSAFVAIEQMTADRFAVYEAHGVGTIINYVDNPLVEDHVVQTNQDIIIGDFVVNYLYDDDKMVGARIYFDDKSIFIASDKEIGYNTFESYHNQYDFDVVFSSDHTLPEGDYVTISNQDNKNLALDFSGAWKIRGID